MRVTLQHTPFPAGTTVEAHADAGDWTARESRPPRDAALDTDVVAADSSFTFTGLAADSKFWAVAQVGGVWKWVAFRTGPSVTALFSNDDPEDTAMRIDSPADQTGDMAAAYKGGTKLWAINGDGELDVYGINAPGPVAFKPAAGDRVRYVTAAGDDDNDGLSLGTSFRQIQAALDDLGSSPGVVLVGGGTFTEFEFTGQRQSVRSLIGIGGYTPGTQITPSGDAVTSCDIDGFGQNLVEGLCFMGGSSTRTGIHIRVHGSPYCEVRNCFIVNPSGTRTPTGPADIYGGIGLDVSNSEGCRFSHLIFFYLNIAIHIGTEGTENTFDTMRGGNSRQDLVCDSNGGGNIFNHWKIVNGGDPTDATVACIDIGAASGSNTFIHADWEEAGPNRAYVRSDNNAFIHCSLSPACHLYVEGDHNYFLKYHSVGGLITVSGANNEFARLSTLGTGITVTDPSNIIDAQDSNTIVTGDHRRRALTGVPAPATSVSSIQRVAPFYSPEGDILGYVPIYSSSAVEYEALIAGTPGLVSRWKLDETVGTTADDDIGGNDGTYNGGATLNQTALVSGSGKSVLFDGVNDNVQVPDAASLDITGDLSLEAWVKLTSKGASEHTIFLKNGSYYMRVIEGATTHYVQFLIWSGAVLKAVTADAGSFTLGTKHHLVGTYDGTNLRVYVDGVLVKTGAATGAIDSTASDLLLMSGVGWAKGNGDDFAVYNVTLPPQTISDHHEVGA